jgi:non-ribosomal peptide synthetase component E (peptide arylation enzyme)
VFAVHGYPIGNGVSTFIVETDEQIVAELPVAKVGKLDKKALRDMLAGRSAL